MVFTVFNKINLLEAYWALGMNAKEHLKQLILILAGIYGEFNETELSIHARPLLSELERDGYIKRHGEGFRATTTTVNISYRALNRTIGRSASVRLASHGLSIITGDRCVFVLAHMTNPEDEWWVTRILEEYKDTVKTNAKIGNLKAKFSITRNGPLHPEFLWDIIHSGIAVNALLYPIAEKLSVKPDDAWGEERLVEELVGGDCGYLAYVFNQYPPAQCMQSRAWLAASTRCSGFKIKAKKSGAKKKWRQLKLG